MKIKDLSVFTKVHVKGQKQIPKSENNTYNCYSTNNNETALDSGLLTLFTF